MVKNTIFKRGFTVRYRECLNKKCRYRFKTKELIDSDWDYKTIVLQIKRIVKDIK